MSLHLYNPSTKKWEIPWGGVGNAALVTTGAGIRTTRWIDVECGTAPTVAGSGTITWDWPVFGIRVESALLVTTDVLPLTAFNPVVRWAAGAANDAAALIMLPTTFPSGDPTAEWFQTGSFNLTPAYIPDYNDAGAADQRIALLNLPAVGVEIPVTSDGVERVDFAHNLGANMTLLLCVSALRSL